MNLWTKLKIWWLSGGDMFCGFDDCGEKMYTASNGTNLLLWLASLAGLVAFCIAVVMVASL